MKLFDYFIGCNGWECKKCGQLIQPDNDQMIQHLESEHGIEVSEE